MPNSVQALMDKAKADSRVTGDRFVPAQPLGARLWCVIDAQREEVIESALSFENALDFAERLSRLDKTQKEDIFRSRCKNPDDARTKREIGVGSGNAPQLGLNHPLPAAE